MVLFDIMKSESETLFIPLLGKAEMSEKGIFLNDPKAEEMISEVDYDFNKLKQSKWLSMFMSLRALILDELCDEFLEKNSDVMVIHLGCGLDSRCLRVKKDFKVWYDLDFENVIKIREEFYNADSKYKMIGSSVNNYKWLEKISDAKNVLVVAEGLTMYLSEDEIRGLVLKLNDKFEKVHLIFDAYTKKGVKYSKIKNPVKQMNAEIKYGIDKPEDFLKLNSNLEFVSMHLIKKDDNNLRGITKYIFNHLYCGKVSQSIYKIWEFDLDDRRI